MRAGTLGFVEQRFRREMPITTPEKEPAERDALACRPEASTAQPLLEVMHRTAGKARHAAAPIRPLAGVRSPHQRARVPVSLATIYNTLNQFTQVGLLREIAIDGSRTYFDTNISDHHHFFIEGGDGLMDIPARDIAVANLPEPPEGMEISRVEVVVRLRKKTN